jgi:CBS domain-containing protein
MLISEVMHRGVTTAAPNDTIRRVAEIMRQEDIGAVPIIENNTPVGFVTDRDIVVGCIAQGGSVDEPVSGAMNASIISLPENADVSEAEKLMKENQISRVVVVDQSKKPIGMVSLHDLAESGSSVEASDVVNEIKKQ